MTFAAWVGAVPAPTGFRFRTRPRVTGHVSGSYGTWLLDARSDFRWDYPHFLHMQQTLDQITAGDLRRVFFQVAIRHGKSEHNTIGYCAYRLEQDPSTRILLGSYSEKQAQKFSRDIRRLVRTRGVEISRYRDTAGEWETVAGGGVRAVGAGAGVASVNADLIVIDDPIGSRDDAESLAKRDQVWDWLTNDILARCEPHTAVLWTMSRWHEDDPAGRMQDRQADRWHIVDLPGRAIRWDAQGHPLADALDRPDGAPLWPELRGEPWLDEMYVQMGEYGFASLVQGRPRPREGGMFKWDWWQMVDDVPQAGPMIRYWDLAGTTPTGQGHDPDYTAGALLCRLPDKRTAIVDVERFRKSVMARDARVVEVARADLAAYPGRVRWWIETESGIAGTDRTATLVRQLQTLGLSVYTEHPTGKKELRAEPLASAAEAQNVLLCPGAWRDAFRLEAADFPHGRHDDQVDAAAGAYSKLNVPVPMVAITPLSI